MLGVPSFTNTAASLSLSTGYALDLGPGTARVVKDIQGWYSPAPMRRKKTERQGAHGTFAERGWKDERLVSVSGHFIATSRAEAAGFIDELAAFLADGTAGIFTVDDPDFGSRWSTVYLTGSPDVVWDGGLDVTFTVDMVAPDPRKYGETVTSDTGVPADGGGLFFDLFGFTPVLSRTNYTVNPRAVTSTGWNYQLGTSEVATLSLQTGLGPNDLPNFIRRTVSTAKTAGNSGWYRNEAVPAGVTGDTWTVSAWVRSSAAVNISLNVSFRVGSTTINSVVGSVVALAPNVWTRLATTGSATGSYDTIQGWAILNSANVIPAGGTIDITQMMHEKTSTLGLFFDGSVPDTETTNHDWTGTANASTSTESVPAAGQNPGILDFGETGDPGTASFTNAGRADATATLRVDGYAPGFTITELTTGRKLVYTGEVPAGSYVVLDPRTGTVRMDGVADRTTLLTVREWTRTQGGQTSVFLFESDGPNARLTVEGVPAWW